MRPVVSIAKERLICNFVQRHFVPMSVYETAGSAAATLRAEMVGVEYN
jgi:hypothetical protein